MSFIFCDASIGKLIDIVEDRRLSTLKEYFMRFSKEAREGVTHIVIDMYSPYMTLIKEVFPAHQRKKIASFQEAWGP